MKPQTRDLRCFLFHAQIVACKCSHLDKTKHLNLCSIPTCFVQVSFCVLRLCVCACASFWTELGEVRSSQLNQQCRKIRVCLAIGYPYKNRVFSVYFRSLNLPKTIWWIRFHLWSPLPRGLTSLGRGLRQEIPSRWTHLCGEPPNHPIFDQPRFYGTRSFYYHVSARYLVSRDCKLVLYF